MRVQQRRFMETHVRCCWVFRTRLGQRIHEAKVWRLVSDGQRMASGEGRSLANSRVWVRVAGAMDCRVLQRRARRNDETGRWPPPPSRTVIASVRYGHPMPPVMASSGSASTTKRGIDRCTRPCSRFCRSAEPGRRLTFGPVGPAVFPAWGGMFARQRELALRACRGQNEPCIHT